MFHYKLLPIVITALALVNYTSGSGEPSEDWSERVVPCQNKIKINSFFENLKDKTRILLDKCTKGQNFELTSDVHISQVKNLQIRATQTSIIKCSKVNTAISIKQVNNLYIENLFLLNCGSTNKTLPGALNIVNCSTITIKGVQIAKSPSTGLMLANVSGKLIVEKSIFHNNGQTTQRLFQQNQGNVSGGGMQVLVGEGRENSFLLITDCKFFDNSASHEGGMFLMVHEEAVSWNISLLNSIFDHNECHEGGGGLQIGFSVRDSIQVYTKTVVNSNLKINIQDCNFSRNQAESGGGVAIFSTLYPLLFSPDTLTFTRCNWTNNSAVLGLAVDIAIAPRESVTVYRQLPSPVFADCKFTGNKDSSVLSAPFVVNKPRSVLFVTGFRVEFRGLNIFEDNLGSAIEATAAVLNFAANSTALFVRNVGIKGGAWNLQALTRIFIHDNSYFLFKNNRAIHSGGAIYTQYADKHSYFVSKTCFIRHVSDLMEPKNLTFVFAGNAAALVNQSRKPPEHLLTNLRHKGDSFWVTSFSPCAEMCTSIRSLTAEPVSISSAFSCLGNVIFERVNPKRSQISTAANHFTSTDINLRDDPMCSLQVNVSNNSIRRNPNYNPSEANLFKGTLHLVPGRLTEVPLRLVDDFCAEIFFMVRVKVFSSKKYMYVHPAHSVITDNHVTLYGDVNQSGQIQLSTLGSRVIAIRISVFLDDCPPGYTHDSTSKDCVCSATEYQGLSKCENSTAFLQHGYWIGYLNGVSTGKSEDRLATTVCPKGFCANNTKSDSHIKLPSNASEDISRYVCNEKRTGLVCGRCRENHSAYYHSLSFACKSNDLCHLGWLFYILSELIPVTLFFLVVIILNISFTSGPLNGVIFFMQFVDTLKVKGENFIWFGKVQYFTYIYKIVYRMFSLNFFAIEPLSFCLWSGASALDLLAFRYVTIVYSLLLILITVVVLKVCTIKRRCAFNLKGSVIHGLSAFLVISYSECTRVSLMILTRGVFRVGPTSRGLDNEYFAFYNGEYSYLRDKHLNYALPAIFFMMTIVSIPPLLLISYPLCYKLFALLRIEETKFVQITCKIFPLEKMKPLFDSFQGAFKDRYRFFAGLYFIYRLCSLITFSESDTLSSHYYITGFQLVIMLAIHAVCRPYKKSWHNVLDTLLFLNLCIINGLACYNYYLSFYHRNTVSVQIIAGFQTVLILLPLVYVCLYTGYFIILKLKGVYMNRNDSGASELAAGDLNGLHVFLHTVDSRSMEDSSEDMSAYNYELLEQFSEGNLTLNDEY